MPEHRNVQRHLVSVWNPSYTSVDAMEAHLAILLHFAEERQRGNAAADDLYVWWGKLRSKNRAQDALANEQDLLAIETELAADTDGDRECHLYLTDYRSLYVAHIDEITREDVRSTDPAHVPAYYSEGRFDCDCWFRCLDFRRLVSDDLPSVIQELRHLHNRHYHDKPVSLYGGMVNLPLIVTRPDGARYFDDASYESLTDGRLWVESDASRSADATTLAALQRDLRDNLFGEEAWEGLAPAARDFVSSAEKTLRDHRGEASFDFTPVVLNLAKAVEVQGFRTLTLGLCGTRPEARSANIDGRTVDVLTLGHMTLGTLRHVLDTERELRNALSLKLRDTTWFLHTFPNAVANLAEVRNRAAHAERIGRREAIAWRNELLGVGCEGVLPRLARVQVVNQ